MNEIRINEADIAELKVSSLPSRPTAPRALGGCGYTATEMKAAFDKLPLFIIQKFNLLLDSIKAEGEGSISAEIPTGIKDSHTLSDMLEDILTGVFSTYLQVSGEPLSECLESLRADTDECLAIAEDYGLRLGTNDSTLTSYGSTLNAHAETLAAHAASLQTHTANIISLTNQINSLLTRVNAADKRIYSNSEKIDAVIERLTEITGVSMEAAVAEALANEELTNTPDMGEENDKDIL